MGSLNQHSCSHVSDEYRKLCTVAALLPARPDLPPGRPDLPPGRPDVVPPPLLPGVYPPQQPEIVYPSRVPPHHGKNKINNKLSLHHLCLASFKTGFSGAVCSLQLLVAFAYFMLTYSLWIPF